MIEDEELQELIEVTQQISDLTSRFNSLYNRQQILLVKFQKRLKDKK